MAQLSFKTMPYDVYEKELLKGLRPSWKRNLLEAYKYVNNDNKDYVLRLIDGEAVVYRDMNNGYDIEVSGLCQRKRTFSIYVWSKDPLTTVHKIHGIKGLEQLKAELNYIIKQFEQGHIKEWGNNWD